MTRDEQIAAVRASLARKGPCDDDKCPGWAVFESSERGMEIQVCDVCVGGDKLDVTDDDVARLPEAQAALELETGEYPCPSCGRLEWRADYYWSVHQGVQLKRGADGTPYADDYEGDEATYDDGSTSNELYRCANCRHEITLGRFVFVPADEERHAGTPLDGCQRALGVLERLQGPQVEDAGPQVEDAGPQVEDVVALLRAILNAARHRGELPALPTAPAGQ